MLISTKSLLNHSTPHASNKRNPNGKYESTQDIHEDLILIMLFQLFLITTYHQLVTCSF